MVTNTLASTSDWLSNALTSPLALRCFAIAAMCVVGLTLGIIILARLGRQARLRRESLLRGVDGTSMMEFTLVAPILLSMALLLAQTTMVMAGNIYVHYAAFAATRAAIVFVGTDLTDQGGAAAGVVDSDKQESIRRAAVMAVLPAAGRAGGASNGSIAQGLHEHFGAYGRSSPNWIDTHADARLAYADANTQVTLRQTIVRDWNLVDFIDLPQGVGEFGPKDPITVRVTHKLALNVPIARYVFGDSGAGGDYATVEAQYTLTNEGVPTPLPPTPDIPRAP